ncbi:MAG: hypothetical protein LBQ83_05990 [Candidatus Margulisbacteria bacterium]|jgi:hypothetical protein|nr:hypothetical protein [Candidatus Margulisiibacteriota bacterium]
MKSILSLLYIHRFAALCFLTGIVLRFTVMLFGHNYDFDSWKIVGEIASRLGNVYALTPRYNYAPVFLSLLGLGYKITAVFPHHIFFFRCFIISILTLADLGIACYIYKNMPRSTALTTAILFFLNPISIIITGYHNQFDNIAVLLVLIAATFYNASKNFTIRDILFIFFLTLSLLTKHLAVFFLFWLFIRDDLPFSKKLAYICVPVLLFLTSFIPFWRGADGIINNVFIYGSHNNFPLLRPFLELLHVPSVLYIAIFITLLCTAGLYFRAMPLKKSIILYTICLTAFSSAIANQYLVIPLAGLFILTRYTKYFYILVIGIYLILKEFFSIIMRQAPFPFAEASTPGIICFDFYQIAVYILLFTIIKCYLGSLKSTNKQPIDSKSGHFI